MPGTHINPPCLSCLLTELLQLFTPKDSGKSTCDLPVGPLSALIAELAMQPRVAGAENMRYEESKKNPGVKAEKTIFHDGEVPLL